MAGPSPEDQLAGFIAKYTREMGAQTREALVAAALERAAKPLDGSGPGRLVIKSISAKQRPRRPPEGEKT